MNRLRKNVNLLLNNYTMLVPGAAKHIINNFKEIYNDMPNDETKEKYGKAILYTSNYYNSPKYNPNGNLTMLVTYDLEHLYHCMQSKNKSISLQIDGNKIPKQYYLTTMRLFPFKANRGYELSEEATYQEEYEL